MTGGARGGGSKRGRGGRGTGKGSRGRSNAPGRGGSIRTEPEVEFRDRWEKVSSDEDEESESDSSEAPVYKTNAEGEGPSWKQAFGVADQEEFTQKALDKENNPLNLQGDEEYDVAVFGNGPYPWDKDEGIDWVPEHKWGPHPDWVKMCWVDGKRVPLLPEGYVGKGYERVRTEAEQDLLQFGVRQVSKEEQHVLAKQVRKPPPLNR